MVQGYEDPEVQNLIDLSAIYNIPMLGTCTVNVYENKYLKKKLKKSSPQIFFTFAT